METNQPLKGVLKKPSLPQIEEEKDAFLSFINKRLRNNNKKLKEIQDLEAKENLKTEQKAKIQNKPQLLENNKYFEGIKDLYYQSLKVSEEEGGEFLKPVPKAVRKVSFEDQVRSRKLSQDLKKLESDKSNDHDKHHQDSEVIKPVPAPHDVREILHLAHFVPFFMDSVIREEFDREFISLRESLDLGEYPDFDAIFDFYKRIFTFAEGSQYETVEIKIATSLHELELYMRRDPQPAIRERSYEYLHEVVKKLAKSSFFKDKSADIKHEEAPKSLIIPATKKQEENVQPVQQVQPAAIHIPENGLMSEEFLKSILSIKDEAPKEVHIPRDQRPDAENLNSVQDERRPLEKRHYPKEKHHYPKEKHSQRVEKQEEIKGNNDKEEEAERNHQQQKQTQEEEFVTVEAKYRKKKEQTELEAPAKHEKTGYKKYKNNRYKDQKEHKDQQKEHLNVPVDHADKGEQQEASKQQLVADDVNKDEAHGKSNEGKEQQNKAQKDETVQYQKGGHKDGYGGHKHGGEQNEGYGYKKGYRNQKGYDNRKGQKGSYQVVYEKKEEGEPAQ